MPVRDRRRVPRKNGHEEIMRNWNEDIYGPIKKGVSKKLPGDPGSPEREALLIEIMDSVRCELRERLLKLFNEAHTDELTGLFTVRMFRTIVESDLIPRMKRAKLPDGTYPPYGQIAMIDFDNFKLINERFGHPGGDRVLKEFGRVIKSLFRYGDTIVRVGGDEFIIVARGISFERMCERLDFALSYFRNKPLGLLCKTTEQDESLIFSFTYAVKEIGDPSKLQDVIGIADRAVFRRKEDRRKAES